jgi:hypothetical protein
MTPSQECPVCGRDAKVLEYHLPENVITKESESGSAAFDVVCSKCGAFRANASLLENLRADQDWENTEKALSIAIRAKSDAGTNVLLLKRVHVMDCIGDFEKSNQ